MNILNKVLSAFLIVVLLVPGLALTLEMFQRAQTLQDQHRQQNAAWQNSSSQQQDKTLENLEKIQQNNERLLAEGQEKHEQLQQELVNLSADLSKQSQMMAVQSETLANLKREAGTHHSFTADRIGTLLEVQNTLVNNQKQTELFQAITAQSQQIQELSVSIGVSNQATQLQTEKLQSAVASLQALQTSFHQFQEKMAADILQIQAELTQTHKGKEIQPAQTQTGQTTTPKGLIVTLADGTTTKLVDVRVEGESLILIFDGPKPTMIKKVPFQQTPK